MTQQAMLQLLAVIVGGLIATAGGLYTNVFIERERRKRESKTWLWRLKVRSRRCWSTSRSGATRSDSGR